MTRHELKEEVSKVLAKLSWHHCHMDLIGKPMVPGPGVYRREQLSGILSDEDYAATRAELTALLDQQTRRDYTDEINDRGNIIHRFFRHGAERYHWDFGPCQQKFGWKQFDTNQDASYFGVWVHIKKRLTLTYCEGDCILVKCPTVESLRAELADMARCYGEPPPAFIACDGLGACNGKLVPEGNVQYFYDERPAV